MLILIACIDNDYGLGQNGQLLWKISEDLKRFRTLTLGKTVVMGRKTYESLPHGALDRRRNIVVTHDETYQAPGCEIYNDLNIVYELAKTEDIYIIGGMQLYSQTIHYADKLCLTLVLSDSPKNTDAWFPYIDNSWVPDSVSKTMTDAKTGLEYIFMDLVHN